MSEDRDMLTSVLNSWTLRIRGRIERMWRSRCQT